MAKEYWYFLGGTLVVVVPLLIVFAVKKLNLLEPQPDFHVTYSETEGQQPLSLHGFRAKGLPADSPASAVLLFHGGGWLYGAPQDMYPQCRLFAEQGFICFSAEYRLGPGSWPRFENTIADTRAAFDYLLAHAEELNIDPKRIALGGGSAGGHMAAAVGVGLPRESGNQQRPAALILYNPVLDLSPGTPHHYLVKGDWEAISPLHHVDAATPPTLILVGSEDPEVPVDSVREFCDAVSAAGGQCEAEVYEGLSHGFFNVPRWGRATNQRAVEFLSRGNPG